MEELLSIEYWQKLVDLLVPWGRHQNMTEILYLHSVKIDWGGGPQILSCKDSELIVEKVFTNEIRRKADCKDRVGRGSAVHIFTL